MAPFKIPKIVGKAKEHPLAKTPLKPKKTAVKNPRDDERVKKARAEMLARAPAEYIDQQQERKKLLMQSKEAAMKKFKARKQEEKKREEEKLRPNDVSERRAREREEQQQRRNKLAEEAQARLQDMEDRRTSEEQILSFSEEVQETQMEKSMLSVGDEALEMQVDSGEMEELLASVEDMLEVPPTEQQQQPLEQPATLPILFHQVNLGRSAITTTEIPANKQGVKVRCFKCRGRNHVAKECVNAKWKDLRRVQKATGVSLFKKTPSKAMLKLLVPPPPQIEEMLYDLKL